MSELKSKVVILNKRRTSVRLCHSEWRALEDICKREHVPRNRVIEAIEKTRNPEIGLTGSIRLFSILYYHALAQEIPHRLNFPAKHQYLDQIFKNIELKKPGSFR